MKWYECSECHDDANPSHPFKYSHRMKMCCKACRGCFHRDFRYLSELDKSCSNCSNRWLLKGITPESKIVELSQELIQGCIDELTSEDNDFFKSFDM
jgi:DNA-directed RNA polymerase subunit RPC12/RpoP